MVGELPPVRAPVDLVRWVVRGKDAGSVHSGAMDAPEDAASALQVGSRVRFLVRAYPSDTLLARVHSVGSSLDPATRTLPVRALVPNPAGRLRPEMFATVWVEGRERRLAALLPDSAVQLLDQRPVVFVATPDGQGGARFARREVQLGGTTDGRTRIVAGLRAGELVVRSGAFAIKSEFARSHATKE